MALICTHVGIIEKDNFNEIKFKKSFNLIFNGAIVFSVPYLVQVHLQICKIKGEHFRPPKLTCTIVS